jgi:NitT/TauT family transport system permease protein
VVGFIRKIVFLLLVLALWQGLVELKRWSPMVLPSPASVGEALVDGFQSGRYPLAIGATLLRGAIGYGLAIVIGAPLGLALARSELARDTLGSLVVGLQTLPSICWLPLAILWIGLNDQAVIFVVVMGAAFAITSAVADSLRNVSPLLLKAGRTLGAEGLALDWRVALPAALPPIVSGLKLGWAFAWRSLMAAELLTAGGKGLGLILTTGRDQDDMGMEVAGILVILVLGVVVNQYGFEPLERRLARRWGLVEE